jgi:hypothetical protein
MKKRKKQCKKTVETFDFSGKFFGHLPRMPRR